MILGRWGYTEYFADAERILRGFLLPSQLRDTSWIEEPPNPECSDAKRDVANRLLGAWGFAAPYGHETVEIGLNKGRLKFNLDVLGGVTGSLCEVYREITRYDRMGHHVNLLFDHETDAIKVESCYTHSTLRVTPKRPGPLYVRVPTWLNDVGLQVKGDAGGRLTNGYLLIPEPPVNRPIAFDVPLPIQHVTLKHRSRDIRVRLRRRRSDRDGQLRRGLDVLRCAGLVNRVLNERLSDSLSVNASVCYLWTGFESVSSC